MNILRKNYSHLKLFHALFCPIYCCQEQVWRGGCRPSWVDPMAGIYWKCKWSWISIFSFVLTFIWMWFCFLFLYCDVLWYFISLNSLFHFYFFKFIYIFDRFYFKENDLKEDKFPVLGTRQFLRSPSRSPRLPSYIANVAIAMLNIKNSDPNEQSCYSSKINSKCIGVQKVVSCPMLLAMNKYLDFMLFILPTPLITKP